MHEHDGWTPKLVGERLVEAVRWARYNAGPTGPASVRALMPTYLPTTQDRELEGWGDPEIAEIEEERPLRRPPSPAKISAMLAALHWSAQYAAPGLPGSARILNLWIRSKVHGVNFGTVIEKRGEMSRASAYRMRDRALAAIAVGLTNDGVKP